MNYYLETIIPTYAKWLELYYHNKIELLVAVEELREGDVIYNMKIGFCSVIRCNKQEIHIKAPGLAWDDFSKSASIKINYVQSKIIKF